MTNFGSVKRMVKLIPRYWRLILCLLVPVILSPILIVTDAKSAKAGYLLLMLTCYLVLELLPIAGCILLTLAMIPTVGLTTTAETAQYYMSDTMFLFLAVLIMAISIEEVSLHNRLALLALRAIGVSPSRLILGFLFISGFLSMWMSNFAVTLMILPISVAITETLKPEDQPLKPSLSRQNSAVVHSRRSSFNRYHDRRRQSATSIIQPYSTEIVLDAIEEQSADEAERELEGETTKFLKIADPTGLSSKTASLTSLPAQPGLLAKEEIDSSSELKKAFQLSIAFGANIGGMATLIGSYNNMLLRMTVEGMYGTGTSFNFLSFTLVALPIVVVALLVTWLIFCLLFIPGWLKSWKKLRPDSELATERTLDDKLRQLGPISHGEISVLTVFCTVIALWLTRDPKVMPGWGSLFIHPRFATDAVPVLFGAVALFIIPLDFRAFASGTYEPLLQWKKVVARLPWEFFLFAGTLMSLIKLSEIHGLIGSLGKIVPDLTGVKPLVVVVVVSLLSSLISEVMGGGLIAAILLPIFADVAEATKVNPLYYMMAITLATQMVFLTPLSSFPTLIVYNSGAVKLKDIVKSGIGPKILCLAIQILCLEALGRVVMGVDLVPAWSEARYARRMGLTLNGTGLASALVNSTRT